MILASNLGFPRIGAARELKWALEKYWRGQAELRQLLEAGRELRKTNWRIQRDAGISLIPVNDFSFYDHVLDCAVAFGVAPETYRLEDDPKSMRNYFALARGYQDREQNIDLPAWEMTKWFDTNYHYIVPHFSPEQRFELAWNKPRDEFLEARALGIAAKPVILGPISFLLLGKIEGRKYGDQLQLLDGLLPVYEKLLRELAEAGAEWAQLDEPILSTDLPPQALASLTETYRRLCAVQPKLKLLLATYFGGLDEYLEPVFDLPVAAIHLDLVRAPEQLDRALEALSPDASLSLGMIDGRNVWRTDLDAALKIAERAVARLGSERVMVAPSCSLMHVPVDLELEEKLQPGIAGWLAFARQKLVEVSALAEAANGNMASVRSFFEESRKTAGQRNRSAVAVVPEVRARVQAIVESMTRRNSTYGQRRPKQQQLLGLPPLPTTTIGSFPQTKEVRRARARLKKGELTAEEYENFLRRTIEETIRFQESIGLDVLVHGEHERNDMVEYFGERLQGFVFTSNGWVQSYGSRCVKPPIIFGDVSRPAPMTVEWISYAQSLTPKPIKGVLTGPLTMMQWSFVRNDQPRRETCRQIALAIRDEVDDLQRAGIRVIQVDEPALREGTPLRRSEWRHYFAWAVEAFRIATAVAHDETQIHSHMCYSEFNEIIRYIAEMDADVLSIEASRSRMKLLEAFSQFAYPNSIGPGVYDIHSPRIPESGEIAALLLKALDTLKPDQLWVNPDCGLKTRRWSEVRPSLERLVAAAEKVRAGLR